MSDFLCDDGFEHRIGYHAVDSGNGARPMGAQICLNCKETLIDLIQKREAEARIDELDRLDLKTATPSWQGSRVFIRDYIRSRLSQLKNDKGE